MNRSAHSVEPEELMAYLDGELPVEHARECAAHLDQCAECQTLAAELKSVDQQLSFWQAGSAPQSVADAVMPEVEKWQGLPKSRQGHDVTATRWLGFRPWIFGLAGGVSAILLMSIFTLRVRRRAILELARAYKPATPAAVDAGPSMNGRQHALGQHPAAASLPEPLPPSRSPSVFSRSPESLPTVENNGLFRASNERGQNSFSTDGQFTSEQQAPMIARTVSVALVTKDFDGARSELDAVLHRHNGYAAQLTVDAPAGAGRSLNADLRIPAPQLDAALAEIKKLGRVEQENQGGEEVTQQYVDLNARLSNARNTEQRLVEVLQQRTGKMADVLEVENEIARVRGAIEQMEAERKNLEHRVAYAALRVQLREEYKASLNLNVAPPSGSARMRNSLVDGLGAAADSLVGFVQLLLFCGPFLLLWTLILFWPARAMWRRRRASIRRPASARPA
jgi:anti-sigma factor RsiW